MKTMLMVKNIKAFLHHAALNKQLVVNSLGCLIITLVYTSCEPLNEVPYVDITADFQPSARIAYIGDTVHFHEKASSIAHSFMWEFGDGASSNEKNPIHVYQNTGNYMVSLQTIRNNGINTAKTQQSVTILPKVNTPGAFKLFDNPTTDDAFANGIAMLSNGNSILLAKTAIEKLEIIEIDPNLSEVQKHSLTNIAEDKNNKPNVHGNGVMVSSGGNYIVTGDFRYNYNNSDKDGFIVNFNPKGDSTVWKDNYTKYSDASYTNAIEVNGNFFAAGAEKDSSRNINNAFINKYATNNPTIVSYETFGAEWSTQYLGATFSSEFIVIGQNAGSPLIATISNTGQTISKELTLSQYKGVLKKVIQISDNSFVAVGTLNTSNADSTVAYIAKFSQSLEPIWEKTISYYSDQFVDVAESLDGNIYALGTNENPLTKKDFLAIKLNTQGEILKESLIGTKSDEEASNMVINNSGDLLLYGTQRNLTNYAPKKLIVIKIDADLN